jgi:hypothetical protein
MADPSSVSDQNILPVQAFFNVDGTFQTFIGQGQPFYATVNPSQSGLNITSSTINSTTIGATTPSTGVFTNIATTTGTISTLPSANNDIANKQYVDAYVAGIAWKPPVNYGTTADITLSGIATQAGGEWTSTLTAGMRILVKNQVAAADNGIYVVSSGPWSRSADADTWNEFVSAVVFIETGTTLGGTAWYCPAQPGGTLGVTAINWSYFSVNALYSAGTGLTLNNYVFSITNTGVTAATYGSASSVPVFAVNAQGQLTSVTDTSIAIAASQITSGTINTARISGSYTGITGVGTLTAGTWNGSTIGVAYGGTGATTLTGYVKGSGTSAFTASTTVPTTDLSGTITNAQLANSTISGVSLGSNLFALTIGSGLSGTTYNGSAAVTITNSSPMVYPGTGIPNSTGTAWGTSYSTSGTGTVVALATSATLITPTLSAARVDNASPYLDFASTTAPTYTAGRLWYDSASASLSYYNDTTNNIVNIGQEVQQQVRNSTGSTILKGSVCYISGQTGQIANITLGQANSLSTSNVVGLANQDIPNNSNGYLVILGEITNIDTSAFNAGDTLYLSTTTPGAITNTAPTSPNYAVRIGFCIYSNNSNGKLFVSVRNSYVATNNIVGQVPIANGGTNGTATPTSGAVPYGTGTAYAFTSAGTSGQVLTSNGSSAPTWTTPTAYATVTDDTTTASTRYPLFASVTAGNLTTEYVSSTKLQYVPSTGVLTATSFSGAGTGLTGTASSLSIGGTALNVTGTVAVGNGGTGVTTLTGLAYGNGTSAFTAATAAQVVSVIGSTAVTNATNATNIGITDDTTTATSVYPTWVTTTTGNLPQKTASTKLSFVPSTGVLSATSFTGAGTGLTGTASSLSIGGNAATATSATSATTATTATNVTGGAAGSLVYQSASATTTTLALGTTNYVLTAGASAPQYVAQSTLSVGSATTATTATNATNVGITDDTTTNATVYPTWVTANTGNLPQKVSSTKLSFNPSTGALTVSNKLIIAP